MSDYSHNGCLGRDHVIGVHFGNWLVKGAIKKPAPEGASDAVLVYLTNERGAEPSGGADGGRWAHGE
jgi:hypothetical protein